MITNIHGTTEFTVKHALAGLNVMAGLMAAQFEGVTPATAKQLDTDLRARAKATPSGLVLHGTDEFRMRHLADELAHISSVNGEGDALVQDADVAAAKAVAGTDADVKLADAIHVELLEEKPKNPASSRSGSSLLMLKIRTLLKRALLLDVYAEREIAQAQVTEWRERWAEAEARHTAERAAWVTERETLLTRLLGSPPDSRNSSRSDMGNGDVAVNVPRVASPMGRMQMEFRRRNLVQMQEHLQKLNSLQKPVQVGEAEARGDDGDDGDVDVADEYLRHKAKNGEGEWERQALQT